MGLTASSGTNAAAEYDVIEANDQTIFVNDGETFENKLIDLGTGNDCMIVAKGTNWTIRNIGFTGTWEHGGSSNRGTLLAVCDSGSGHSTIENVFFGGELAVDSSSYRGKQIWVDPDHSGHLDVRNVNFSIEASNGIYGSAPSRNSGGSAGSIHVEGCYALNSHHSAYRVTGGDDVIRDCVAVMEEDAYSHRTVYVEGGPHSGQVTVENVHITTKNGNNSLDINDGGAIRADGVHYTAGTLEIDGDVDWIDSSTNPRIFVPEGCPTSAEAAASGETNSGTNDGTNDDTSGDDGSSDLPDGTIVVEGTGEPCQYRLEVDGTLVEDTSVGALGKWGEIDGSTATSWVTYADRPDGYRFDGDVVDLEFLQGEATVTVNGESVDESDFEESTDLSANTLVVNGVGTDDVTRYEFSVSGSVEKSTHKGASTDDGDAIDDGTVTGTVAGWLDAFAFDGELEDLHVTGPATVEVNDEPVDPADYGDDYAHTVTVVGQGVPSSYEVTVDGELRTFDEDVSISGNTATATIEGGVHEIQFSGALTDVTFVDGEADVYLDDERIDPDTYGDQRLLPHALVIDGSGSEEPSSYSFTIDGAVAKAEYRDANINADDEVDGSTVRGVVDGWIDAYWFDGDIDDFTILGDASVDVEYNVRDQ